MRDIDAVNFPESQSGFAQRKPQIDRISQAKSHNMGVVLAELQRGRILRQRGHIHLEKVDGELPVNVVQLVLVTFFLRCSLWNLFQIISVIGTLRIDTLVNYKARTVFFADKRMPAIRAFQL